MEGFQQQLNRSVQSIQSELTTVDAAGGVAGSINAHARELQKTAGFCLSCHHAPEIHRKLDEIQAMLASYQRALGRYTAPSAGRSGAERAKQEAAAIGNTLLRTTRQMSALADKRLEAASSEAIQKVRRLNAIILLSVGIALIAGLTVAVYLIRRISRPIDELLAATRELAAGNLGHRVDYRDDTEFGELAAHFNAMSASLEESHANLQGEIAQRLASENALRESEERHKGIADNLPGIVFQLYFSYDGEIGTNYLTHRADDIFGINNNLQDLFDRFCDNIHDNDRELFYVSLEQAITSASAWHFEGKYLKPSGETLYVKVMAQCTALEHQLLFNGIILDITDRWKAEVRVGELAFYDQLTGLPNRALLLDRLRQAISASSRSGSHGALLFIDLDQFKTLNDTLGHDMGDLLLKQVAERLSGCMRLEDTTARFGGDEFVVMLCNLSGETLVAAQQAETVGEKILSELRRPYQLAGVTHNSTASMGVTLFCGGNTEIEVLLRQADIAMYRSKDSGRDTIHFFDQDMENVVMLRAGLETDLRLAFEAKQFELYYQVQIHDERPAGVEALVRWLHPRRGVVGPNDFIPLAEETRLIIPLGSWILETACRQLASWGTHPVLCGLSVAVNISVHQFQQPDFVDAVLSILQRTGANPRRLKLELTESMFLAKIDETIAKMEALKKIGIVFSLDDFGTGYSSLSYLKRLPLDQLKIDQSFVRDVVTNNSDASISRTVIALARNLGLEVIAEGVETVEQLHFLNGAGCTAYQGYYFSRPVTVEALERLLLEAPPVAAYPKNTPLAGIATPPSPL